MHCISSRWLKERVSLVLLRLSNATEILGFLLVVDLFVIFVFLSVPTASTRPR
ncbi:hypothetical protein BDQ12DRAFT_675718 [Crucibulum laeve]|uniref:Uncharacterized protein n=1 Tax=Crucibulum laeve TaxID=68775 RepID=A0A5C3MIX9_9AGAR|nr:hypothetical protein BDQ12DRAFT_675718 [Crucibulum laeve]